MSAYTGAGQLLRTALRTDRIVAPVWIYALAASVASTAWSFRSLYPSAADRNSFAAGVAGNDAIAVLYGPLRPMPSLGEIVAWRILVLGGVLLGVCVIFLVIRHSRADEQQGRAELVRSAAVGRSAPLTAAVALAGAVVAGVAVLVAAALLLAGLPANGALGFAAAWAGLGGVFVGVAAVCAQLADSARTCRGLALGFLGLAYALRAVADIGPHWLSWAGPLGWAQQQHVYTDDRWPVLVLPAVATVVLLVVAGRLQARRDLGAGWLPTRPGPPRGGRWLRGVPGLTARLGRGVLLAWAVGLVVWGLLFGTIASAAGDITKGSAATRQALERLAGSGSLVDLFLGSALGLIAIVVSAYGVAVVARAADEEASGRLELLLSTPTARLRWWAAQVVEALAAPAVALLALGAATGFAHGVQAHDLGRQLVRVLAATATQLPALWALTGLAILAWSARRRLAGLGWALVGACVLILVVGTAVRAPSWLLDLSPFRHVPATPGAAVPATAVGMLLLLATAAVVAGAVAFRRRDLG